jgi:Protein of unknown function (DUF2934)
MHYLETDALPKRSPSEEFSTMSTQTDEVSLDDEGFLDRDVESDPRNPPARGSMVREIADLAYRYWVERQRNGTPGSDIGDWLRAESHFLQKREAALDEASEESFPASDAPAR